MDEVSRMGDVADFENDSLITEAQSIKIYFIVYTFPFWLKSIASEDERIVLAERGKHFSETSLAQLDQSTMLSSLCFEAWQGLQIETSHSIGSFPMFIFAYLV